MRQLSLPCCSNPYKLECWRTVVGWNGYEVSCLGNVRGRRGPMKTFLIDGYPSFNVISGAKRKSLRLHREVLIAFRGLQAGKLACHADGNPANCRLDNLRWDDHKGNEADKKGHGTKMEGERHHQHKLTAKDVISIRSSPESNIALAEQYGVHKRTISNIRRRVTWRCLA